MDIVSGGVIDCVWGLSELSNKRSRESKSWSCCPCLSATVWYNIRYTSFLCYALFSNATVRHSPLHPSACLVLLLSPSPATSKIYHALSGLVFCFLLFHLHGMCLLKLHNSIMYRVRITRIPLNWKRLFEHKISSTLRSIECFHRSLAMYRSSVIVYSVHEKLSWHDVA